MASGLALVGDLHFSTAQSNLPTSTPASTIAFGESGNLNLTMTIDKNVYSLDEPINLTLTITNISNQTIDYTHSGLDFDFQVNNDTTNTIYQWSNFKAIAQFITIVPLPSGESRSANFTWQQTCNFNPQVNGILVSAGTYYIVGETGPTYGIKTTPIQIIISNPTTPSTSIPTSEATSTPTSSPSVTTLPAMTDAGSTVDLTISGNVTSTQISNVEISTNQSATSTTVSFAVTGEGGTIGFSNVTIPKSAVTYGTTPTIYIDGQPASNQGYTQDNNNYYVWYTTHFSIHQVSIVFTVSSSIPEFPTLIAFASSGPASLALTSVYKKKLLNKYKRETQKRD